MHDDAMADGDPAPDGHGLSRIGVNDAMILDIGVLGPIVIHSLSPRSTAPNQMLAPFSSRTFPISTASGAIQQSCGNFGCGAVQCVNRHRR